MDSLNDILGAISGFEPPVVLDRKRPVLVYGAGGFGRDVARALREEGYEFLGFVDGAPKQEWVDGFPCRALDSAAGVYPAEATVLVGILNYKVDPVSVRDVLHAEGFRYVFLPIEFHHQLEKHLGIRYWLGDIPCYRANLDKLQAAHALLDDEKSRALFLHTLQYRALARVEAHPLAEPETQYFPTDIAPWEKVLHFVDGGACDGDTLRTFPHGRYEAGSVYAFEPDLMNFVRLQAALRDFGTLAPTSRLHAWPCGLGDKTELLRFHSGQGAASAASHDGESFCSILPLDAALARSPVNVLKLDIEGAELAALTGAQGIISEQKPGLAVCVYHTPEHLWEIPLMLAQRHPVYRFALRCHGQSSFDLVLYALPK